MMNTYRNKKIAQPEKHRGGRCMNAYGILKDRTQPENAQMGAAYERI